MVLIRSIRHLTDVKSYSLAVRVAFHSPYFSVSVHGLPPGAGPEALTFVRCDSVITQYSHRWTTSTASTAVHSC
eukprot:COSAG02_NODE_67236_length_253_cov_0.870130_1_plen_73_part_10